MALDLKRRNMIYKLLLGLIFLLPVFVIGGMLYWIVRKPSQETKALEARAAAGDPAAKEELARLEKTREAMRRLARGGDDPERQRILATGQQARAEVVDVKPLGLQIAPVGRVPRRMVEVRLAIDVGGGPRQVTVVDVIAEPLLGRILKGASIPARVDPFDPEKIAVLWDTL